MQVTPGRIEELEALFEERDLLAFKRVLNFSRNPDPRMVEEVRLAKEALNRVQAGFAEAYRRDRIAWMTDVMVEKMEFALNQMEAHHSGAQPPLHPNAAYIFSRYAFDGFRRLYDYARTGE